MAVGAGELGLFWGRVDDQGVHHTFRSPGRCLEQHASPLFLTTYNISYVQVKLSDPSELDKLMDASAYSKHCEEKSH